MLNRLILKVTKFQLPPPKRLGTVAKNILGCHHGPNPCQVANMQNDSKAFCALSLKNFTFPLSQASVKVVVRAEILPRDFLQTLGNYYLSLTIAKFEA